MQCEAATVHIHIRRCGMISAAQRSTAQHSGVGRAYYEAADVGADKGRPHRVEQKRRGDGDSQVGPRRGVVAGPVGRDCARPGKRRPVQLCGVARGEWVWQRWTTSGRRAEAPQTLTLHQQLPAPRQRSECSRDPRDMRCTASANVTRTRAPKPGTSQGLH